jgi:hypothetical protein
VVLLYRCAELLASALAMAIQLHLREHLHSEAELDPV